MCPAQKGHKHPVPQLAGQLQLASSENGNLQNSYMRHVRGEFRVMWQVYNFVLQPPRTPRTKDKKQFRLYREQIRTPKKSKVHLVWVYSIWLTYQVYTASVRLPPLTPKSYGDREPTQTNIGTVRDRWSL